MKAIIMAAGVGSRISRHVDKPKCLLEIEGVPLLRRTADMLIKNNIMPVVVAGYQHKQIENSLNGTGVPVLYNPFYRVTNSLGSLWFAKEYIPDNETLLLMNADVFWEQDIMDILLNEEKDAVLLADSSPSRRGLFFRLRWGENRQIRQRFSQKYTHARICWSGKSRAVFFTVF